MLSDEPSSDSDSGIRFKTDSTRRPRGESPRAERPGPFGRGGPRPRSGESPDRGRRSGGSHRRKYKSKESESPDGRARDDPRGPASPKRNRPERENKSSRDAERASSSSPSEDGLGKKPRSLEREPKRAKKKSKHKNKRREREPDGDRGNPPRGILAAGEPDALEEEGEIPSDSDERSRRRPLDDSGLPDLRDGLSKRLREADVSGAVRSSRVADDPNEVEGPALPPHMLKTSDARRNAGPSLPDEMRRKLLEDSNDPVRSISDDENSASDDEVYGPMPGDAEARSESHRRLAERALMLKTSSLDGSAKSESRKESREEWMLKLPDAKARSLGLSSRQFRKRDGPDLSDRSSWTDTPEQKALKAMGVSASEENETGNLLMNAEREFVLRRDAEQESLVKKYKKKNKHKESLLEMHQKKLKKKKKVRALGRPQQINPKEKEEKEKGKPERRPFDRNIDLKANHFDEAQKNIILKRAQLLDTKFAAGESKYL